MKNVNFFLRINFSRLVMLTALCALLTGRSFSQTTLSQGDLSFMGFCANASGPSLRTISFVTWVDLLPNTVIKFTDNGFNNVSPYNSTTPGNYRQQEQVLTWTSPGTSTVLAGTVISINGTTPSVGTAVCFNNDGTTANTSIGFLPSGEQIFAFQTTAPLPVASTTSTFAGTLLYGIGYNQSSTATTWLASGAAASNTSAKPADLPNTYAMYFTTNTSTAQYTGPRTGFTSAASYKALVNNMANWTPASTGVVPMDITAFSLATAPAITSHPSNSTVCDGVTATFSATASDATSYQWTYSDNGGSSYSNVPASAPYSGTTSTTLTITGPTTDMNGYMYKMVATGAVSPAATSNAATLTVNSLPFAGAPSNSTICAGASTSFSSAISDGTSFQWQFSTNGGSSYNSVTNGGVYSGATSTTLNITGATAGMNGYRYRLVVSGACSPAATSTAATLTVNSAPSISAHPQSTSACGGGNASFSVTAANATGYQWQANSGSGYSNITNGGVYSGATTATLNIIGANGTMDGNLYRVIVTGACTPNATSSGALLTVNSAPVFLIDPQNEALCEGDNVNFSVFASNTDTYQWQVNTGSGFANITDNGTYSGTNTSTLSISSALTAMSGYQYRAVAAGSCSPNATSAASTLTVYPLVTYYFDNDGDGYGDPFFTTSSCTGTPFMFVANNLDCNDYDNTIYPGAPEICNDGIDNDCDGDVDENCVPTTQIDISYCGTTLEYLNTEYIPVDPVTGAEEYEFKITNGAYSATATDNLQAGKVRIIQFAGYQYGTTYQISARAKVGGVWGDFGSSCAISTTAAPHSEIDAAQCGTTLPAMNTTIYTSTVNGATQYRFRVINGANVQIIDRPVRTFNLTMLASYEYNTTYTIDVAVEFGGTFHGYSSACNVTTPTLGTSVVLPSQCGTTLAAITSSIFANPVSGATNYRFRVVNGANVQTIDRSTPDFKLTFLPSQAFSTTYTVDVAIEYNGTWQPYGSACNVTTPAVATTEIQPSQCGITLASMSTYFYANSVSGATAYRFRLTEGANSSVIDNATRAINFTMLSGHKANTTYAVEVAAQVNGVWGAYGNVCNLTTPAVPTKVQSSQCGTTLPKLDKLIYADAVTGATQYRFRVTNGANVQTIDRTTNSFYLTQLANYAYGTTYTIDAAVLYSGVWQPYGAACNVTTPVAGTVTTALASTSCGVTLTSYAQNLEAEKVVGATQYEFQVQNAGLSYSQTVVNNTFTFTMSQLTGLANNTTYTVKVRTKVNNTWSPYGTACNVTTPGSGARPGNSEGFAAKSLTAEVSFDAVTFPNPFSNGFGIGVTTAGTEPVSVTVYDMSGKVLEKQTVAVEALENLRMGEGYAAGMYQVQVIQGTEAKTLKVVKQ